MDGFVVKLFLEKIVCILLFFGDLQETNKIKKKVKLADEITRCARLG